MTERLPHHELQMLLGAYVLGGLDSDDRRQLEEHLPSCQTCTAELSRFAGVPSLLQLAPSPSLAPSSEPATAPEDSLPRLIAAANAERSTRQRRRWMLAAAAMVIVLSGVVGGVMLVDRNTGPTPTEVVSADAHVVGSAVLSARDWGTEVHLELSYLPRGPQPYTAWAVDRYGHEEQAAAWRLPTGGRCSVTGATSFLRADLDRIEIRSADGETLLRTR